MKLPPTPFVMTDWSKVPPCTRSGEEGFVCEREVQFGSVRVRLVEYSAGYRADHWCDRGHIVYVLDGQITTQLRDGRVFTLTQGASYTVSDCGDEAHQSSTNVGAKLFIVD